MKLPDEISQQITKRSRMFGGSKLCSTCSAHCCKSPGFGIFENSVKIYDLYKAGKLVRKDYQFVSGLNYKQFIAKYFDCFTNGVGLTFFYPKVLINDNNLLSAPSNGDYPSNRNWILSNNDWLINYGCVFLQEKVETKMKFIGCILHNDQIESEVTEKPIDCVFHGCIIPGQHVLPQPHESSYWFSSLNYFFNGSVGKFESNND